MKRGPKPKTKINTTWTPDFAYAIGLLATDGCLYKDDRHIDFTSKDIEQIRNFLKCLKLNVKVSLKKSGLGTFSYHVQFSNAAFWKFLNEFGITPAKSLTIGELAIPEAVFFDFVRGCFDGDGYSHSYWDKRWHSSFLMYVGFVSSSPHFIHWLKRMIFELAGARGHITRAYNRNICYQLRYSTHEAVKIVDKMYEGEHTCLSRKKLKVCRALAIMKAHAETVSRS